LHILTIKFAVAVLPVNVCLSLSLCVCLCVHCYSGNDRIFKFFKSFAMFPVASLGILQLFTMCCCPQRWI